MENKKFYIAVDKEDNLILTGDLNHRDNPDLNYADWTHEAVTDYIIENNLAPTKENIWKAIAGPEAETMEEVFKTDRDELELIIDGNDDLVIKELNKDELKEVLNFYNLEDLIKGIQEEVIDRDETGELEFVLKDFTAGEIIFISACVDSDCRNTDKLIEDLNNITSNEHFKEVVGYWNGIEERSFMVHITDNKQKQELIDLGNKYTQEAIGVVTLPVNIEEFIQVDKDGTKLAGIDYYLPMEFIELDKAKQLAENKKTNTHAIKDNVRKALKDGKITKEGLDEAIYIFYNLVPNKYLNNVSELFIALDEAQYDANNLNEHIIQLDGTFSKDLLNYFKNEIPRRKMKIRQMVEYGLNGIYIDGVNVGKFERDFTEEELNIDVIIKEIDFDRAGYVIGKVDVL